MSSTSVTIRIPDEQLAQIKRHAKRKKIPYQTLINRVLLLWLFTELDK
jgi:predicted DNA binding CopG/RHH family protein